MNVSGLYLADLSEEESERALELSTHHQCACCAGAGSNFGLVLCLKGERKKRYAINFLFGHGRYSLWPGKGRAHSPVLELK